MCQLTLISPTICPCKYPFCHQRRPTEISSKKFTGGHLVNAEEIINPKGLPCDTVFLSHGRQAIEGGRGDRGMLEISLRYCPELKAVLVGDVSKLPGLCEWCRKYCRQD